MGVKLRPPSCHWDEETAPRGHEIKRFFVSPSMLYAGLPVYAPQKRYGTVSIIITDNPDIIPLTQRNASGAPFTFIKNIVCKNSSIGG